MPATPDLLDRLRAALLAAGLGPTHLDIAPADDPEGRTLAAGLVLLYPHPRTGPDGPTDPDGSNDPDGPVAPHLVLTQRSTSLRRHSGQISLPGGRYEIEDGSLLRTALRETQEELGVDPASLTLWGRLEPEHIVATHYALAPFVAYTPRRPDFVPAPAEVAEVIDLPLALLLEPSAIEEEVWDFQGAARRVSFFRYRGHKIWGATARILSQIVLLLDPGRTDVAPFAGAAGETGRKLPPGDTWPRSVRPTRVESRE